MARYGQTSYRFVVRLNERECEQFDLVAHAMHLTRADTFRKLVEMKYIELKAKGKDEQTKSNPAYLTKGALADG